MVAQQTVMVALDGSACAEAAVPHAAALAARLGARLVLVCPVLPRLAPWDDPAGSREARAERMRAALESVATRVGEAFPQVSIGLALPVGTPAEVILDEAMLVHAGLIATTTHRNPMHPTDSPDRLVRELLRRVEVPLLLVRPERGEPPPVAPVAPVAAAPPVTASQWTGRVVRLLIPLDGTAAGEAALPFVVRLGASIPVVATLLHVLPVPVSGTGTGAGAGNAGPLTGAERRACCRNSFAAAAYCHRAADWMSAHGVPCRVELRVGRPPAEIVRATHETADVLVAGQPRHRVSAWEGPTTLEEVLRTLRVPLLAVPCLLPASGSTSMFAATGVGASGGIALGGGRAERDQQAELGAAGAEAHP